MSREAVIAEARTWLNTPYHHRAAIKGAGVDCAQILVEVYSAVGMIEWFDTGDYPPDFMMHRDEERYLNIIRRFAGEVETPKTADVAVYKVGRCFAHGGIVVDWPTIIHASSRDRGVVLGEGLGGWLADRDVKFFSLWDDQ